MQFNSLFYSVLAKMCRWLLPACLLCGGLIGCTGKPQVLGEGDNPAWPVVLLESRPGTPDFEVNKEESRILEDHGWRNITVLKNTSTASLTIIRPPEGRANGSAMIILPGGAFGALAWDIEGTEVGEYLADLGITAFVLKYRVRDPNWKMMLSLPFKGVLGAIEPGRAAAADDAKQALAYVRDRAAEFGLDQDRVGMIGFSAGAITVLRVLKETDDSIRPDVAASIYGMMFDDDILPKQTPLLVAVARDDASIDESREIHSHWLNSGAPVEFYEFEDGGHGFGLGQPGTDSEAFAPLLAKWLQAQNFIR